MFLLNRPFDLALNLGVSFGSDAHEDAIQKVLHVSHKYGKKAAIFCKFGRAKEVDKADDAYFALYRHKWRPSSGPCGAGFRYDQCRHGRGCPIAGIRCSYVQRIGTAVESRLRLLVGGPSNLISELSHKSIA